MKRASKAACTDLEQSLCFQALGQLKRLETLVGQGPLKLPEQNMDQLKSLLSTGPYPYLRVPLPRSHSAMNLEDLSQVRIWRPQVVGEFNSAQKVRSLNIYHQLSVMCTIDHWR